MLIREGYLMVDSIDQLKSMIGDKGGIARPNMFRVELPTLPGATSSTLNLLCKDVVLPGRQILSRERQIGVPIEKIAYGYGVEDVSMTFHVLNDYGVKQYFEYWQNLAVNQNTYELGYKDDYAKQVKIQQLRKGLAFPGFNKKIGIFEIDVDFISSADVVYECVLEDAYPTTMNNIVLNNEMDGVVELNVQLSYKNWRSSFTPPGPQPVLTGTLLSRFLNIFN
jgi:hypothetical protein